MGIEADRFATSTGNRDPIEHRQRRKAHQRRPPEVRFGWVYFPRKHQLSHADHAARDASARVGIESHFFRTLPGELSS
jgi:hypothetical protein